MAFCQQAEGKTLQGQLGPLSPKGPKHSPTTGNLLDTVPPQPNGSWEVSARLSRHPAGLAVDGPLTSDRPGQGGS